MKGKIAVAAMLMAAGQALAQMPADIAAKLGEIGPILDPADAPPGPNVEAYFGKRELWADRSLLGKLEGRKIPVFLVYAGLDPKEFRDEAMKLREGLCERDGGACPRTSGLKGHNHISEIAHLGSQDDTAFGLELLDFVKNAR